LKTVGVLFAVAPRPPRAPGDHALGRVVDRLRGEGIALVIAERATAGHVSGYEPSPDGWRPVEDRPIVAAYHRFPSRVRPGEFAALRGGLGAVPIGNHPDVVELCDDKLATQALLQAAGLPMPAVEADPARFAARLAEWGAGFLKPRYGAFGRGVRRVTRPPVDLDAGLGPWLLQAAVPPPRRVAGVSVRQLVQREPTGEWVAVPAVVRESDDDPVVNVARGARVGGPERLAPGLADAIAALSVAAAGALAAAAPGPAVEFGVDVVVDHDGRPWVIEVNGKPRGRLEVLAEIDPRRWQAPHFEACARPLRFLALTSP
jgi:glutathione synthase/RimK-type ligase-like ATP-grasp enzyme